MEYLMFYEAFKSNILTALNKFLINKVGKKDYDKFLKDIKLLKSEVDIPISRIYEDDLKYLSKNKGYKIKAPKDFKENELGNVYGLKFWFSLEDGYLGYTGIGSDILSSKKILIPKNDYLSLKTGEKVLFERFKSKIVKGTVFKSENSIYIIQDYYNGGIPIDNSWRKYGNLSWCVYYEGRSETDHYAIYKNKKENITDYNMDVDISKDKIFLKKHFVYDIIKKSDFCLYLNLDNLVKGEKIKDIKNKRFINKKGAISILNNEEVKNANFGRYMSKIIHNLGINEKQIENLKNLEKIIKIKICNKYPIYSDLSYDHLDYTFKYISDNLLILQKYKDDKEKFNKELKELNKRMIEFKKSSIECAQSFKKNEKKIINSKNKYLSECFKILKTINNKITEYISSKEIKTISELEAVGMKLDYIMELFKRKSISKSLSKYSGLLSVLSVFNNEENVDMFIRGFSNNIDEETVKDLKNIEKIINKHFL